ncbi:hypothetical protein [Pseudonocardia acaciae]|uniref:hypothetical protein n=1 Tax=Pseudonocardia acaciae TaxID=551276 RepID=UPI0012EE0AF3|nr:hypothetical protein [Pseudonocardia acaciae]
MFGSRISATVPPRLPGTAGSALGFGAAVAATLVAWPLGELFGAASRPVLGLVLLAVVAVGVGSVTTLAGAVACAAQCWALYSGFVLHRFGELWLDPPSRFALALLVTSGAGASLAGLACGAVLARHRIRAVASAARAEVTQARRPVLSTGGHRMR